MWASSYFSLKETHRTRIIHAWNGVDENLPHLIILREKERERERASTHSWPSRDGEFMNPRKPALTNGKGNLWRWLRSCNPWRNSETLIVDPTPARKSSVYKPHRWQSGDGKTDEKNIRDKPKGVPSRVVGRLFSFFFLLRLAIVESFCSLQTLR